MKATFSGADWRAASLEIGEALAVVILAAKPSLSSEEASTLLRSAEVRLREVMVQKGVSGRAIELTVATMTETFTRRCVGNQSGTECSLSLSRPTPDQ